jgi:hypothetical protein
MRVFSLAGLEGDEDKPRLGRKIPSLSETAGVFDEGPDRLP